MIKLLAKTNQEAFDMAYRGVISQGCTAMQDNNTDTCTYYNSKGHACGIGHLIPSVARPNMLNRSILDLLDMEIIDPCNIDEELLQSIQRAHDRAALDRGDYDKHSDAHQMMDFHNNMINVADGYKLNTAAMLSVKDMKS